MFQLSVHAIGYCQLMYIDFISLVELYLYYILLFHGKEWISSVYMLPVYIRVTFNLV